MGEEWREEESYNSRVKNLSQKLLPVTCCLCSSVIKFALTDWKFTISVVNDNGIITYHYMSITELVVPMWRTQPKILSKRGQQGVVLNSLVWILFQSIYIWAYIICVMFTGQPYGTGRPITKWHFGRTFYIFSISCFLLCGSCCMAGPLRIGELGKTVII